MGGQTAVGVSLAELAAGFYVWLLVWLVAWAAVPALTVGWEPVLITSGSMGPVISAGDLVLLSAPPRDEPLQQGTVITFEDPLGGLVTHRIDDIREDGLYRTRGDANGRPDPDPVAPDQVVGVGRMLVPLIGLPALWLRQDVVSLGLFLAGTGAALAVVALSRRAAGRHQTDHEGSEHPEEQTAVEDAQVSQ